MITTGRNVYLPPGQWIDYQTGGRFAGGWHNMQAGQIPVVMLVRDGAVIPHMKLAQSTTQMDWTSIEMVVYAATEQNAQGLVCLPADNVLRRMEAAPRNGASLSPPAIRWRGRRHRQSGSIRRPRGRRVQG